MLDINYNQIKKYNSHFRQLQDHYIQQLLQPIEIWNEAMLFMYTGVVSMQADKWQSVNSLNNVKGQT